MSPTILLIDGVGEVIESDEFALEFDSAALNFVMEVRIAEDKEIGEVTATKRVNQGEEIDIIPDELRVTSLDRGRLNRYIFEVTGNSEIAEEIGLPVYQAGDVISITIQADDAKKNLSSASVTIILK